MLRKLFSFIGRLILFGVVTTLIGTILVAIISVRSTIKDFDFRDTNIPIAEDTEWNRISDTQIQHQRIWNDYHRNQFRLVVDIPRKDYELAHRAKNNIQPNEYNHSFWGYVYQKLIDFDEPRLKQLEEDFAYIGIDNGMTALEFANTIVSFVQDIPYVLITTDDCQNPTDPLTKQYISQGIHCSGLQNFGIHSPIEFMSTLEGDCDTRTVFSYLLLAHFGYDVAILVSNHYRHSILAVNLPGYGNYKEIRGKRFYTWETTAPRLQLGQLAPSISDMSLWDVELLNIR